MDTNFDKRMETYNTASEAVQELYGSELTTQVIKKAGDTLNLQEPARGVFVITVGDIILGLYKKESLGQLLKDRLNLTEQQIITAENDLSPLMAKLTEIPEKTSTTPVLITAPTETSELTPEKPADQITKPPNIEPLRTFARDVENSRTHGYGVFRNEETDTDTKNETTTHTSSQDDILGK